MPGFSGEEAFHPRSRKRQVPPLIAPFSCLVFSLLLVAGCFDIERALDMELSIDRALGLGAVQKGVDSARSKRGRVDSEVWFEARSRGGYLVSIDLGHRFSMS